MTNEPLPLPHKWLAETKKLQEDSFGYTIADMSLDQKIQYIKDMVLALEDEAHEVLGEVSWKPWANDKFINRREYIKELVDLEHFVANLLIAVECTDEEFWAAYQDKMDVNRERQRRSGGYSSRVGVTKCQGCARSFDDVGASEILAGMCLKCEASRVKGALDG